MMDLSDVLINLEKINLRIDPKAEQITDLKKLTAGASKNTYRFVIKTGKQDKTYILRTVDNPKLEHDSQINIKMEAAVLKVAQSCAIKVPCINYILQEGDSLGEGYVMDFLIGETIPRKIIRDVKFEHARTVLASQFGQELAKIHAININLIPELPSSNLQETLARFRSDIDRYSPSRPVFEYAYLWLLENQPVTPEQKCIVHGDFRNGNVMIDQKGLVAVLDWELCHIGDPMEDLAWLLLNAWRFGNAELAVGGIGREEDLFEAYLSTGGQLDLERVRYWQVACTLRWGLTCSYSRFIYQHSEEKKLEHALIARRVSETELDLLRLLKVANYAS